MYAGGKPRCSSSARSRSREGGFAMFRSLQNLIHRTHNAPPSRDANLQPLLTAGGQAIHHPAPPTYCFAPAFQIAVALQPMEHWVNAPFAELQHLAARFLDH